MFFLLSLLIPFIVSNGNGYEVELESSTRWEPIRVYFDLQIDDAEKKSILKQTTDSISAYLKKLLKVHPCKYIKLLNKLEFTEKQLNGYDFYILIKSLPPGDDASASTSTYVDRNNDFRPKASLIKINLNIITKASTIDDNPRDLFELIIHEVFHALGISSGMFQYWIDPDQNKQYIYLGKNIMYNCTFSGINREFNFISTKNIKEFIKRKYGDDDFGTMANGQICEAGIELEDDGGEGSKWKHPEMRVYPLEIMGYLHQEGKKHSISDLTLTMLNSSGYYQVNFDMAEPYVFGYPESNDGKPINKFVPGIPARDWPERYQCNPGRYGITETATSFQVCDPDLRYTARCNRHKYQCPGNSEICSNLDFIDPFKTGFSGASLETDYIAFPSTLRSCEEPLKSDIDYTRYGSTVGKSSVCLVSNARNQEGGWTNPEMLVGRCFTIECDDKFTKYTVTLADGSQGVCERKGQNLTFPDGRYKYGHIECSDPYWTCYANNGYHPPNYVPPSTETAGDTTDPAQSNEEPIETAIITVAPEKTPVPDLGPTVDSTSFIVSGSSITLTGDGYKDGDKLVSTKSSTAEIILIKMNQFKFEINVDPEEEPSQKRYISPLDTGATITVNQPKNGSFGVSQIGIDSNGRDPQINIPVPSVPLNFYSNESSVIKLVIQKPLDDPSDGKEEEVVESISVRNVLLQGGKLLVNAPIDVSKIEYNEISAFNNVLFDSVSGNNNNPITTAVQSMTLNQGCSFKISKLTLHSNLTAGQNAKVTINGHVTFDSESTLTLSHLSFIDLGESTIDGAAKSVTVISDAKSAHSKLLENEEKVICGANFKCSEWLSKFNPTDDYPQAKCPETQGEQQCLVAVRKDDGSNGGGKGKNKTVIIAVVVVVVVVVIAAVVVTVIIIMKKRKGRSSANIAETNETNEGAMDV